MSQQTLGTSEPNASASSTDAAGVVSGSFTPGPWHWVDNTTDKPYSWGGDNEGTPSLRTVAVFGENKTEVRHGLHYTSFALPKFVLNCDPIDNPADASLIAAAPELLYALTDACAAMVAGMVVAHKTSGAHATLAVLKETLWRARSAIARATGAQS